MQIQHTGYAGSAFQGRGGRGYIQTINGEEPKMIITTEHDLNVWKEALRQKLIQIMAEEYSKIDAVLGYNVDETPRTTKMNSIYPFDERVEADMKDLIDDAFWQISRDLAREEAA